MNDDPEYHEFRYPAWAAAGSIGMIIGGLAGPTLAAALAWGMRSPGQGFGWRPLWSVALLWGIEAVVSLAWLSLGYIGVRRLLLVRRRGGDKVRIDGWGVTILEDRFEVAAPWSQVHLSRTHLLGMTIKLGQCERYIAQELDGYEILRDEIRRKQACAGPHGAGRGALPGLELAPTLPPRALVFLAVLAGVLTVGVLGGGLAQMRGPASHRAWGCLAGGGFCVLITGGLAVELARWRRAHRSQRLCLQNDALVYASSYSRRWTVPWEMIVSLHYLGRYAYVVVAYRFGEETTRLRLPWPRCYWRAGALEAFVREVRERAGLMVEGHTRQRMPSTLKYESVATYSRPGAPPG